MTPTDPTRHGATDPAAGDGGPGPAAGVGATDPAPRHRFTGHDPAAGSDSGGLPWEGRTLTGTGFDDDTGEADPRLAGLLAVPEEERDERELVAAVAAARLIVPIVAVPSEVDESSGIPVDAVSDMASVTLVAPDGQQALPAFTSTAALARWNEQARPVPVTARRAAQAALQEGCDVMPLDLAVPPGAAAATLRPSMVWALATGRVWVHAHEDEEVVRLLERALADQPDVVGHALGEGAGGALEITLVLPPGLTAARVQEIVRGVGERLAGEEDLRTRVDALAVRLATAS